MDYRGIRKRRVTAMSHEDMLSAIKEEYLGKLNASLTDQYRKAAAKPGSKDVAEWIDEFTKKNALDELFKGTKE
jgi:hypothetical protein